MKCLVTGSNGYIGIHLIEELVRRGHQVHAFVLKGTDTSVLPTSKIRIFEGQISSGTDIRSALEGCEVVYHLASRVSPWEMDPGIYREVNVEGTRTLLDACLEKGVRRVLISSSCGIFGPSGNGRIVSESTASPLHLMDSYERSKYEQAQLALSYTGKGLEVVVVYPTRVFGPGIKSFGNMVTRIIRGALDGTWRMIPGSGKNIGNYVFVDDVAKGMVMAMAKGANGEGYILGGQNASYDELFETIQHLAGRKIRLFHIPFFLIHFAGRIEEWRARWTGKRPLITTHSAWKFTNNWSISIQKVRKELGYHPTPLAEAIRLTITGSPPAARHGQAS